MMTRYASCWHSVLRAETGQRDNNQNWLPGSSEVLSPFEDTDGREIHRTLPSLKHYPAPFTVLSQLLTCTRSYLGACR